MSECMPVAPPDPKSFRAPISSQQLHETRLVCLGAAPLFTKQALRA